MFDKILEHDWLRQEDRLEAMTGRAIGIQEAGDTAAAEIALSGVVRFFRHAQRQGPMDDHGLVAEAAFRMGDIARQYYMDVRLEFPLAVLRQRLEYKCQHLITAQHRYLQAIRHGDAHTVAAAGFHIGMLYETLYDALTGMEAPSELTSEQREVYQEEVTRRVRVLLRKSIRIYENALRVGRVAPTASAWIQRLNEALERLKGLYLASKDASDLS
ncbi:MAG: hypothetical protein R3C68_19060 [Myxococcota bacterium]